MSSIKEEVDSFPGDVSDPESSSQAASSEGDSNDRSFSDYLDNEEEDEDNQYTKSDWLEQARSSKASAWKRAQEEAKAAEMKRVKEEMKRRRKEAKKREKEEKAKRQIEASLTDPDQHKEVLEDGRKRSVSPDKDEQMHPSPTEFNTGPMYGGVTGPPNQAYDGHVITGQEFAHPDMNSGPHTVTEHGYPPAPIDGMPLMVMGPRASFSNRPPPPMAGPDGRRLSYTSASSRGMPPPPTAGPDGRRLSYTSASSRGMPPSHMIGAGGRRPSFNSVTSSSSPVGGPPHRMNDLRHSFGSVASASSRGGGGGGPPPPHMMNGPPMAIAPTRNSFVSVSLSVSSSHSRGGGPPPQQQPRGMVRTASESGRHHFQQPHPDAEPWRRSVPPQRFQRRHSDLQSELSNSEDEYSDDDDESIAASSFDSPLTEKEKATQHALLERSYHLPGNNYSQDLLQYLINSNPLFGIFFRHRLHPVNLGMRLVTFLGSMLFGLAITNIIYLAFVLDNRDFDASYYQVSVADTSNMTEYAHVNDAVAQVTQVDVTAGMITLWTVGGLLHALYDNLIWSLAACACCLDGGACEGLKRYRKFTPFIVMFLVVGTTSVATLAVLIRATVESNDGDEEAARSMNLSYTHGAESYRFLIAFAVEIVISLFIWSPLLALVMFTGVLGCCSVPVLGLGGRPAEMRAIEQSDEKSVIEGDESSNADMGLFTVSSALAIFVPVNVLLFVGILALGLMG